MLSNQETRGFIDAIQTIFQINILDKKGGNIIFIYQVNLKHGNGGVKQGKIWKPDTFLFVTEKDFLDICNGKISLTRALINVLEFYMHKYAL